MFRWRLALLAALLLAGSVSLASPTVLGHLPPKPTLSVDPGHAGGAHLWPTEVAQDPYSGFANSERAEADFWFQKGKQAYEAQQYHEAHKYLLAALQLNPAHARAHVSLGHTLRELGHLEEARLQFAEAMRADPYLAEAWFLMGGIYGRANRHTDALIHFRVAAALNPQHVTSHLNLGIACHGMAPPDFACAQESYEKTIRLDPKHMDAYCRLGDLHRQRGHNPEAIETYRRGLQAVPGMPCALNNLFTTYQRMSNWTALQELWPEMVSLLERQLPAPLDILPALPAWAALSMPFDPAMLLKIARRNGEHHAYMARNSMLPAVSPDRRHPDGRLRLAYISADFIRHPTAQLMMDVPKLHDRSRYSVYCYAVTPDDGSTYRRKLMAECEHFVDLTFMTDEQSARRIRADEIDILIDLNGYTKDMRQRVLAMRPAPVQVEWLGYAGTTGAPYLDYIVADDMVIPPEYREHYSEKVIYMPHTYFVSSSKGNFRDVLDPAKAARRSEWGLPEDQFVFVCFNQLYKIDEAIFDVWMRILKRVPNSVLWLLSWPADGVAMLKKEAEARGIPTSRLRFSDTAPIQDHIRRGALADLFLDSPLYGAHTTGTDILWAGTPMVTVTGPKWASRVPASLLRAVGLPELITHSLADYEELAVRIATDPAYAAQLKTYLRTHREQAPLFDTARFVRNLERGLSAAFDRWTASLPADDIFVRE